MMKLKIIRALKVVFNDTHLCVLDNSEGTHQNKCVSKPELRLSLALLAF